MANYKGTISVLNAATKVVDTNITLNCGISMPIIGFGTFTIRGKDLVFKAVDAALQYGYRSFDTATVYGNEQDIGLALKQFLPKYNLKREDIFVTSKLAPRHQGTKRAKPAVEQSLRQLGLDYLDLYLIHWPGVTGISVDSTENAKLRAQSWQVLLEEHQAGKLKAIGVSNYTARHLAEMPKGVPPAINQVEFHPHYEHPIELYNQCVESNILLQSYSTLGGNEGAPLLLDPTVISIGKKLDRTPAQILLRWALQRGYGIIPKSVTPERILVNSQLNFELSASDMDALNGIPKKNKYSWDPHNVL